MRLKKMTMGVVAGVLAMILMLSVLPVSALRVDADAEAQLVIGSVIAKSGDTVEITATLQNAPELKSMAISNITYDTSKMTLTNAKWLCDAEIKNWDADHGRGVLTFGENMDANGPVLKMTFQIQSGVADGELSVGCSVTLTAMDANEDEVSVAATVIPGTVTIKNEIPGDMDGNKKVNSSDAVYLLYNAIFGDEEYPLKQSGDVDGNGKKDSNDAVYLLYHVLFGGSEYPLFGICTHSALTATAAKAPTCTEEGNIAYWFCGSCGKYFSDAEAKTEIAYADTRLELADHTVEKVEKTESTCTETGTIEHWKCTACGALFADANAKTEITEADTKTELAAHTLNKIAAKEPTLDEPGNREYWKCGICGKCFSDGEAKTQVTEESMIELAVPSYTVTFVDKHNWPTGNTVKFAQSEPLLLTKEAYPAPAVEGYEFQGWYTSSEGGVIVDSIPAGNTENKMLFAHWDPESYAITYNKAPVHNNTPTYTIEEEVILTDPEWSGLKFIGWEEPTGRLEIYENQAGETAARIPKGTSGNIEITAKWTTFENLVNPKENGKLASVYDPDTGKYYFLYELGMIENVPLDQIFEHHEKTTTGDYTMSISKTVTVETSKAQTIAQAMSNSVTQTQQWQNTMSNLNEGTFEESFNLSLGMDVGVEKICQAKFQADFGFSASFTTQSATETMVGNVKDESTGLGKEYSSTITYAEALSTTSESTMEISGAMPNGTYAFVHAGDIRVFALVTYDPIDDWYYMNTYSVLDNMHTIMLYYADKESMYDSPCGGLTAEVPVKEIKAIVESGYYVRYNANGGDGTMPGSVFLSGESGALVENKFTKLGYTFDGWELTKSDLTKVVYQDKAQVCDLAAGGETVELVAKWKPNTYTVTYEGNGANGGSTASSEHTYDEEKSLTENGFTRQYTVTYYCNGGTVSNSTATAKYSFDGWLGEDGKNYADKAVVLNLKSENNATIKMTAQWKPAGVTLPLPTRTGYEFAGWYADENFTEPKKMNGETFIPTQDTPLYAKWTAKTYTVTYDANGGTVDTTSDVKAYDSEYGSFPIPERAGYAFAGWYNGSTKIEPDTIVTTASAHTLKADWEKTEYSVSVSGLNKNITNNNNDYTLTISPGLDREALKALEYTKLELHFHFKGRGVNPITHNTPRLRIYSYTDTKLYDGEHNAFEGAWGDWTWRDVNYTMSIDNVQTDGSFWTMWSTSGGNGSDGWCLDAYTITVVALKEE